MRGMAPSKRENLILDFEDKMRELKYEPSTVRAYRWQVQNFINFCGRDPKRISCFEIEDYLRILRKKKVSKSFFLQACATLKILYRHVYGSYRVQGILPILQEKMQTF